MHELIILNDLHLSEGWDTTSKRLSRNEDFFYDTSFERFLKYLDEQAFDRNLQKYRFHYKLILNGDIVDFLQILKLDQLKKEFKEQKSINGEPISNEEINENGLGASPHKTVWKLKRIFEGHWIFFRALAVFLAKGHTAIIIPGNHDIEWVITLVQETLRDSLAECPKQYLSKPEYEFLINTFGNDEQALKQRIRENLLFVPWFYYDSDLSVFVEHGNQYDELNSFDYFLHPFREDDSMDLPAGSFFVRYLFNKVEMDYPFADNMKPVSKFIWWALWKKRAFGQILTYIRFFWKTLRKAGRIDPEWAKQLTSIQEDKLEKIASGYGISVDKLLAIKALWVPSALQNVGWCRLIKKFLFSAKSLLQEKAGSIREILGVHYVVFGHTHEADLYSLNDSGGNIAGEYINSATWTKSFAANPEEALLKEENELVYVHVRYDQVKQTPKIELLRWVDGLDKGERVRLFEEKSR